MKMPSLTSSSAEFPPPIHRRGDLYRKDRGVERDADIDDRLRRPIAPDEKLTGAVPLADEWKQRLDELLQTPERSWNTHPVSLAANEKVLALSADGMQILVSGARLGIADSRGENRKDLSFNVDPQQPVFLSADSRAVIGFSENKFMQWDTASGRVVATYEGVKESPAATIQSFDGTHIFLISAAGQVEIIEPLRQSHVTVETDARPPRSGQQFSGGGPGPPLGWSTRPLRRPSCRRTANAIAADFCAGAAEGSVQGGDAAFAGAANFAGVLRNEAWIAHRQRSEELLAAQPPSDGPPSGGGE